MEPLPISNAVGTTTLLANSVASYVIDQLSTGNDPTEVFIPGFSNVNHPKWNEIR